MEGEGKAANGGVDFMRRESQTALKCRCCLWVMMIFSKSTVSDVESHPNAAVAGQKLHPRSGPSLFPPLSDSSIFGGALLRSPTIPSPGTPVFGH